MKFLVNWPFVSEEEVQNIALRRRPWRSSQIYDQNDFMYFDQVAPKVSNKFRDSWPFGPRFSDWNDFSYFSSTRLSNTSYQVSNWSFGLAEVQNIFWKMATVTAIIGFRSKRFWLFCILRWPLYQRPSFESTGHSVQEKKFRIAFQDGGRGGYEWSISFLDISYLI